MSLIRFDVALYDPETGDWMEHDTSGSVCLPAFAPDWQAEHALALVGVYAPRGADFVEWTFPQETAVAVIYDALGEPMVRLWPHEKGQPS